MVPPLPAATVPVAPPLAESAALTTMLPSSFTIVTTAPLPPVLPPPPAEPPAAVPVLPRAMSPAAPTPPAPAPPRRRRRGQNRFIPPQRARTRGRHHHRPTERGNPAHRAL